MSSESGPGVSEQGRVASNPVVTDHLRGPCCFLEALVHSRIRKATCFSSAPGLYSSGEAPELLRGEVGLSRVFVYIFDGLIRLELHESRQMTSKPIAPAHLLFTSLESDNQEGVDWNLHHPSLQETQCAISTSSSFPEVKRIFERVLVDG